MYKKEIIEVLKSLSKEIRQSPGRRDISNKFYKECINKFGSFNLAKKAAGLKVYRRKCEPLPEKAYLLDKELAKLVSFITFDGHLRKDLKEFEIISKNKKILIEFKRLIKDKFGVIGRFENGTGYGKSIKYRVANVNICKFLNSVGVAKGDKMINSFDIPNWVKSDEELAREYAKIAFYCEGCMYKKSKNTYCIALNMNKWEHIIDDGLNFLESLKDILRLFEIESTRTWISKGNLRNKDSRTTKMLRFAIKSNSTNIFINTIGWLK